MFGVPYDDVTNEQRRVGKADNFVKLYSGPMPMNDKDIANIVTGNAAPALPPVVRPQLYWSGPVPPSDDFQSFIFDEFVDGMTTIKGAWATMSPESYKKYGVGLGPGRGQRYRRQPDGRWLKVEG
jgi:hypothetical protein